MAMSAALVAGSATPGAGEGPQTKFWVKITASGSYSTNGDTVDLSKFIPGGSVTTPIFVNVQGSGGNLYGYAKGTNMKDGKVLVFIATTTSGNSPLSQHSAAAYNASVTGDTIIAEVTVRSGAA